jgi:hypothetical protein
MPDNKKKTIFLAAGELFVIVVCACLLSASIIDTPEIKGDSEQKKLPLTKVEEITPFDPIIDNNIEADIVQTGRGSWYGGQFHRRRTASGERFDMHDFTAAHRTLPFGTIVRVTDITTEKSVLVCINDRGPFIKSKVIDLSKKAAQTIGGSLRKLRLEAYLPGKSLLGVIESDNNCSEALVGFGTDQQLKSAVSTENSPWTYTDSFSNALAIQKELTARFPDNEILISKVSQPFKGGRYAVFLIPANGQRHNIQELYGIM